MTRNVQRKERDFVLRRTLKSARERRMIAFKYKRRNARMMNAMVSEKEKEYHLP